MNLLGDCQNWYDPMTGYNKNSHLHNDTIIICMLEFESYREYWGIDVLLTYVQIIIVHIHVCFSTVRL